MVEQFQSHGLADCLPNCNPINEASSSEPLEHKKKWIRVAPKKRGRSIFTPRDKRGNTGGILINEPAVNVSKSSPLPTPNEVSSLDKGKGKAVLVDLTACEDEPDLSQLIL